MKQISTELLTEGLMPSIIPVGRSQEPVLMFDNVLNAPSALIKAAKQSTFSPAKPGTYPGIQAPLPSSYVKDLLRFLDPFIRQHLLDSHSQFDSFNCNFSLVTAQPNQLHPLQRIPHIDVAADNRIAILHYLCDEKFGGTSFFRQTVTDLEQVFAPDKQKYMDARTNGLSAIANNSGYPDITTAGYHQTATFVARYNRILVYRSCSLHSGVIASPDILTDDPQTGRLTANIFANYKTAG